MVTDCVMQKDETKVRRQYRKEKKQSHHMTGKKMAK
jgi:hypothetical protein